jgi:hypothetical protein
MAVTGRQRLGAVVNTFMANTVQYAWAKLMRAASLCASLLTAPLFSCVGRTALTSHRELVFATRVSDVKDGFVLLLPKRAHATVWLMSVECAVFLPSASVHDTAVETGRSSNVKNMQWNFPPTG